MNVIQIIFRGSDDAQHDIWCDVCPNLLPEDDAFHRMIKIYERVGKRLSRHVLCSPRQYTVSDGITEEELKELRDFDPLSYKMFAPPPNASCVISGRYVIQMD